MATLFEIAEYEDTETQQLFVRAARLFARGPVHPSTDHARWLQGGGVPAYMSEYQRYWNALKKTETHRDRVRR